MGTPLLHACPFSVPPLTSPPFTQTPSLFQRPSLLRPSSIATHFDAAFGFIERLKPRGATLIHCGAGVCRRERSSLLRAARVTLPRSGVECGPGAAQHHVLTNTELRLSIHCWACLIKNSCA